MPLNSFSQNAFSHVFIDIGKIKSIIQSSHGDQMLIGLTGGIASGKTTVAEMFRRCGAQIVDFDILSREAVELGTKGLADITASFGFTILDKNGYLDRKALSQIVFQDKEKRRELERVIHPAMFDLFCQKVKEAASENVKTAIIAVAPLLIEMNLQILFNKVIVVYVSSDIQHKRLMQREKIDQKRADAMIESQLPIETKKKYADFLIDNSGMVENTLKQVQDVWKKL
ncbi:MAG: dephospho-CoA kinase [Desulfamplus sp.]|nr:dephospho-CoA kinase [Desulfamplus sp.]